MGICNSKKNDTCVEPAVFSDNSSTKGSSTTKISQAKASKPGEKYADAP